MKNVTFISSRFIDYFLTLSVCEKILTTTSSLALADVVKFLLVAPSSPLFFSPTIGYCDIMTVLYSLIQAHNFLIVSGINVDGFSSIVLATHFQRKQVDAKTSLDKVLKSSKLLYII